MVILNDRAQEGKFNLSHKGAIINQFENSRVDWNNILLIFFIQIFSYQEWAEVKIVLSLNIHLW